jgi:hypothetical protein
MYGMRQDTPCEENMQQCFSMAPLLCLAPGFRDFGSKLPGRDFRSRFISDLAPVPIPDQALANGVDVRPSRDPFRFRYKSRISLYSTAWLFSHDSDSAANAASNGRWAKSTTCLPGASKRHVCAFLNWSNSRRQLLLPATGLLRLPFPFRQNQLSQSWRSAILVTRQTRLIVQPLQFHSAAKCLPNIGT